MSKNKNKQKQKEEPKKPETPSENLFDAPEVTEEVDVDALNAEAETELADATLSEGSEEPKVELEVLDEEDKPRRCIGHHPITKEKVYR